MADERPAPPAPNMPNNGRLRKYRPVELPVREELARNPGLFVRVGVACGAAGAGLALAVDAVVRAVA